MFKMDLQSITNSPFALELGQRLGGWLPRRAGYWLADQVGGWMGGRKQSRMVQAIRTNQWVVSGRKASAEQLDQLARATLRATGRCLFDFFHFLRRPQMILRQVEFTPRFEEYLSRWLSKSPFYRSQDAMLMVCPHLSNFDLIGRVLALRGIRYQVLSYPQPPEIYQRQNRLREIEGMVVTPISVSSLRQAEERLRAGGIVLTGVDRPLPDSRYRPRFFGLPAALPALHVRLALKLGLPIIVVGGLTKADGSLQAWASEPVEMRAHSDLYVETVQNAEAVLAIVEPYIAQHPEQWSMFYPVWPELMGQTP